MSIAVAVRKNGIIALGSDSQTSFGSLRMSPDNHVARKIRKIGMSYLASTGWGLYENILSDFLSRKKTPPLTNSESIFSFFMLLWKNLHEAYPFVNDQSEEEDSSPFGDLDASFLVVNKNGIFYVGSDMSVTRFERYFAIGSGCDYGLGALFALYDQEPDAQILCRKAVEAGIAFNDRCGGPIEIVTIKEAPHA